MVIVKLHYVVYYELYNQCILHDLLPWQCMYRVCDLIGGKDERSVEVQSLQGRRDAEKENRESRTKKERQRENT